MESVQIKMTPDNLQSIINVSQYDKGREIVANLTTETGAAYEAPDGSTATLQGTKPSGLGFSVTGTIDGAKVTFLTTESMTAEAGRIPCEIVIENGGTRIGSANSILAVEESPHKTGTPDGTKEEIIDEITVIMNEAKDAALDAIQAEGAAIDARDAAQEYAESASDDADRAERAADRAEGVSGISLIGDVKWIDDGFNTTGSMYNDVVVKADRALTANVYPSIISLTAQADSALGIWVKCYDENGKALRLDGVTINRIPVEYTVPDGAKFIRISAAAAGAAGAEALNIKISLRQDLTDMEDIFNRAAIDVKRIQPEPAPYVMGSINQISRLGWHPSAGGYPPVQSLPGYAMAYANKCRIMLADVRLTADGHYVCWHDDAMTNSQIRHPDGSALTAEEKAQTISTMTLAQLDEYDFGIFKGQKYAGLKMLRLDDFLKWCADMNVWSVLEMKVKLTNEQITEMATMIKRRKMEKRTVIACQYIDLDTPTEDPGYAHYIYELPEASMLVFGGQTRWERTAAICKACAAAGTTTYIGHTRPWEVTQAMIDEMRAEGIGFVNATDIDSEEMLHEHYSQGYTDIYDMISSAWVNILDYLYDQSTKID